MLRGLEDFSTVARSPSNTELANAGRASTCRVASPRARACVVPDHAVEAVKVVQPWRFLLGLALQPWPASPGARNNHHPGCFCVAGRHRYVSVAHESALRLGAIGSGRATRTKWARSFRAGFLNNNLTEICQYGDLTVPIATDRSFSPETARPVERADLGRDRAPVLRLSRLHRRSRRCPGEIHLAAPITACCISSITNPGMKSRSCWIS